VKARRVQGRSSRVSWWGCLTAVLLGVTSLGCPPAAADNGPVPTVISPSAVERPLPETTPSGTLVLRGPPPSLNAGQSDRNDQPVAALPQPGGWGRNYDTTGVDRSGYDTTGLDPAGARNYDTSAFDRRFDRSGLSRP